MTDKFLFAALACASFALTTVFAEVPAPNLALDVYAKPGELVAIGNGKRLNLRCSGSGSLTVVLESGAITDSMSWSDVQPLLAKTFRVCSYDRAGYGFSEGAASAPYIESTAKDLHALLQAAKIAHPVVLVGHSLGTNIVREYASRYPTGVSAIVLLDPPAQKLRGRQCGEARGGRQAKCGDDGIHRGLRSQGGEESIRTRRLPAAAKSEVQRCA
jgi:pimeloyl-ACP methyl ester carboxylesterase